MTSRRVKHQSMKTRFAFSLLLVFAILSNLFAQVGPKKPRELDDYTPRTLEEISQLQGNVTESSNKNVTIHGEIFPTRVTVVYEVSSRPLGQNKKDTIRAWANRFAGAPETYTRPYLHEVLFSENGRKYWLAVREEFLPKFAQELKKGDTVELFLIKLGSARKGQKWEPVLLAEKFFKPNEQKKQRPLEQWPMECEGAATRLDFAVIDTKKSPDTYLIIVARLGTGEPSNLNQIRLANAKEYVLRRGTDLKYVLAVGERVSGLGRLEVYVGGRLAQIMPFKKNAKGYCLPGSEGW